MWRVRQQVGLNENLAEWVEQRKKAPCGIAFLDTGIAAKHPDFDTRLVDFQDFVRHKREPYDDSGHGTHVCGIAAGNGRLSNGKYRGMAPNCHIMVGKVLDQNGDGSSDHMLEGIEWILDCKEKYQIRVLNISIGIGILKEKEKKEKLIRGLEKAWNHGLVVVCAAGNLGPERSTISPLGESSLVITVGCHDGEYFCDRANRCETYSGRGPTEYYIKKPDIVAPGTDIMSCNAGIKKSSKGYLNPYVLKSGTSMATPIVAGAAALLIQTNEGIRNTDVKSRILYSATDMHEPWTKQGWGMLHVGKMLQG